MAIESFFGVMPCAIHIPKRLSVPVALRLHPGSSFAFKQLLRGM
jgi:hypothetical protein